MRKYALILVVVCIALGGLLLLQKTNPKTSLSRNLKDIASPRIEHSSHLFDPAFFNQAYEKGQKYKKTVDGRIAGNIIPHHLLAAPLIAGFFEGISDQDVQTIILISPNHHGVGPYNIATSKGVWTTIFGDLQTDASKVTQLESEQAAFVSEELFDTEHGIYGITPFIKKTFPNSKIVPIAINSGTSKEECDKLVEALNKITDDNTIIIVSADFSHYLPSDQADLYDRESIPAIESFNTEKVFSLDHVKNIDSPESVYTLLKLMQLKKAINTILLENTNSAKLASQLDIQSTTSYLTMYFTKSEQSKLSLDSIFQYVDPSDVITEKSSSEEYTIIATGDVMPARSVNSKLVQLNDFSYPYKNTAGLLKSADAVFINLETPLIPNCKPVDEGMIFCGDQRNAQGLVYAGVSVANVANNHMNNYGIDGINSTVNALEQNNIKVTGNEQPATLTIRSKKFGFLGYNNVGTKEKGIAWTDSSQIQADILALKEQVDFVIVALHWGAEYTSSPNATQIKIAHTVIDAGADLIIGNHPHWVQGVEQYKGKFISYSHGNYVFDQMWSQETREGVLGKYTFNNKGVIGIKFVPIIIDNYSQPRFANEPESKTILDRMKKSSLEINPNL